MFNSPYFYHETLRNTVVAFGTIFNNIHIHRTDSDNKVIQKIKVPLSYAPKEKFLTRLEQQPNLEDREFAVTLPRMGFEITGINYDSSRKLNKLSSIRTPGSTNDTVNIVYNPVPYNISFNLYAFTATAEGGLQIVEQIMPYFAPDYTITVNLIRSMNIKRDVPIVLNNVTYDDTYDGSYTQRRAINWTMSFTAKTYLFGPVNEGGKVIKKTIVDLYTDTDTSSTREERIITVPNPTSANADDDFGFTTTIQNFSDSKNFDPEDGTDK